MSTAGSVLQKGMAQAPPPSTPIVFDGVTVIDVEQGTRLPAQRVVVVGHRIQAVGPSSSIAVPPGAQVIDAQGKYLIPGLWDMHVHLNTPVVYSLLLANGVTGMRDASSPLPLATLRQWWHEIEQGTLAGPPRQVFSGAAIDESDPCVRTNVTGIHVCVSSTDSTDVRRLVAELRAAGATMLKMYGLSPQMYFALAAEARRVGMPFGGHAEQVTAIEASDSGASIVDHPQFQVGGGGIRERCLARPEATVEKCQEVAGHFRRNGTWWVPTLIVYANVGALDGEPLSAPGYRPILQDLKQRIEAFESGATARYTRARSVLSNEAAGASESLGAGDSLGLLAIVRRAGLPIMAGTDQTGPGASPLLAGFSLQAELALYVAEGLTPLAALQAATLNPAKFLHATDSLGTIAAGKLADLVLLDGDPLEDIANTTAIRAVMANGRYFDRAALDQLLKQAR